MADKVGRTPIKASSFSEWQQKKREQEAAAAAVAEPKTEKTATGDTSAAVAIQTESRKPIKASSFSEWQKEKRKQEAEMGSLSDKMTYFSGELEDVYGKYKTRYLNDSGEYAGDVWRADAADWQDQTTSRAGYLKHLGGKIKLQLESEKDSYDADTYSKVMKYLDDAVTSLDGISKQATEEYDVYSKYGSAEEYDTAVQAHKDYEDMVSYDLAAASAELDSLKAKNEEYKKLKSERDSLYGMLVSGYLRARYNNENAEQKALQDPRVVEYDKQLAAWGDISGLEKEISDKTVKYNTAKRLQEGIELTETAKNAVDFAEHSKYSSTKIAPDGDDLWSKIKTAFKSGATQYSMGYEDLTYEYINNVDGIRDEVERQHDTYSRDNLHREEDSIYKRRNLDWMTEDEIGIYNYYYAKEGQEKANTYLESIREELNYRKALADFEGYEGKTFAEMLFGVAAGLDQFESGIKNLFSKEDYIPVSDTQQLSGMIREDLGTKGAVAQGGYDLVTTTANMLPSVLTSAVVGMINPVAGQVVGAGMMGASSAGNAYQEMINRGYDKGQARTYAALVGGSEATLSYLLGGIGKLGGKISGNVIQKMVGGIDNAFARAAIKLGGSLLSEATEEGLQEILSPFFENLVLHADNDWSDVKWNEVAYSALMGALSAGLLESGGTVSGEVKTYKAGKQVMAKGQTGALVDFAKALPADSVAHKLAGRVNEKTGAYTIGRLLNEAGADSLSDANMADIQASLEGKGIAPVFSKTIAKWMNRAVSDGANFNAVQRAVLEHNPEIAETFREVVLNRNSTVNQRLQGYMSIEDAVQSENVADAKSVEEDERKSEQLVLPTVEEQTDTADESKQTTIDGDRESERLQLPTVEGEMNAAPSDQMAEAKKAEDVGAMPTDIQKNADLQSTATGETERGMTNGKQGTENVSDANGERDGRARAGGQAGILSASTRRSAAAEQRRAIKQRTDLANDLGAKRVSSRELGLARGTDHMVMREQTPNMWDDAMRATAERVQSITGKPVRYVLGSIEIRTRKGIKKMDAARTETTIYIRSDSMRYTVDQLADHEMFHDLVRRDPSIVREITEAIKEQYSEEDFAAVVDVYKAEYAGVYEYGDDAILEEIYADAYAGMNKFSKVEATVYSEIVHTIMNNRQYTAEAAESTNAAEAAEEWYSSSGRSPGDEYYSIESEIEQTYAEQVDAVLDGRYDRTNAVYMGNTPEILRAVGLNENLPMLTTARHLRDANKPKNTKEHHHGLTRAQLKKLPEKIANPVMIMDSLDERNNSIVVVTDMMDPDGSPVIAVVRADGKGTYRNVEIDSNFVKSYYGRDGFNGFLDKNLAEDTFLYINKKRSQNLFGPAKKLYLGKLNKYDFDTIIRKTRAKVKENSEIDVMEAERLQLHVHEGDLDAVVDDRADERLVLPGGEEDAAIDEQYSIEPGEGDEDWDLDEDPEEDATDDTPLTSEAYKNDLRYRYDVPVHENPLGTTEKTDTAVPPEETTEEWQARIRQEKEERTRTIPKEEFKGSESLNKLGVQIAGTVTSYDNAEHILADARAAEYSKRTVEQAKKRLHATSEEISIANQIVAGVMLEEDIPARMNADKIMELADYFTMERAIGEGRLPMQRRRIAALQEEKMDLLFADFQSKDFKANKSAILKAIADFTEMPKLNYRTPERNMRNIFGDEHGMKVYKEIFEPTSINEAEKYRFINRMYEEVRTFKGTDGKEKELNKDERAAVQMIIEGRAAAEAVAGMEIQAMIDGALKEAEESGLNLLTKNRRRQAEFGLWLQKELETKKEDVSMERVLEAAQGASMLNVKLTDRMDTALSEHGLNETERKIAKRYAFLLRNNPELETDRQLRNEILDEVKRKADEMATRVLEATLDASLRPGMLNEALSKYGLNETEQQIAQRYALLLHDNSEPETDRQLRDELVDEVKSKANERAPRVLEVAQKVSRMKGSLTEAMDDVFWGYGLNETEWTIARKYAFLLRNRPELKTDPQIQAQILGEVKKKSNGTEETAKRVFEAAQKASAQVGMLDESLAQYDLNKTEQKIAQKYVRLLRSQPTLRIDQQLHDQIVTAAENIANGMGETEALSEYDLKSKHRDLARQYARWLQNQKHLESAKIDNVRVENAVAKYKEMYGLFYNAINDFLVVHGMEPIGFIPGYAPHMQGEETKKALQKSLRSLGIGEDVGKLPTAIAGLTGDYKPNKRWTPYLLQRHGDNTVYDIAAGYESYVEYLADLLYHTDDIMRVRAMAKWFRRTFSEENISENISWASNLRYAPNYEKEDFLRRNGLIADGTVVSRETVNRLMDEFTDAQYKAIERTSEHGNFVMWLDNYANILAAKQSIADRGWEGGFGRPILRFGNKLVAAFARANVAGNISSALNQTAQLPMILSECGDANIARAVKDIVFGKLSSDGWREKSDFLVGKGGVNNLVESAYDKAIGYAFKPLEFVDSLLSTIAVRARWHQNIQKGMDPNAALKEADRYAANVMGSRMKGEKPLGFHSKNPIANMVNIFQVEALNTWEHMSQDLPHELRVIAQEKGKNAAAGHLAVVIVKMLLAAFVLNRLTEELYGGTPAPFDFLGLAANFTASGEGLTTNEWIRTIIDNGWEKLTGERLFDTDELDEEREFEWNGAFEDILYNISNEVPFLRNVSALLGWGDDSLPLPDVKGSGANIASSIKNHGVFSVDTAESAGEFLMQFMPGGRQVEKTYEGIKTMAQGGKYKNTKDGRELQYPVDGTFGEWLQATVFGNGALEENDEYYAADNKALTAKQTQTYEALVESGADRNEVYDTIQAMRKAESSREKRDILTDADLTDRQKLALYCGVVSEKRRDEFSAMMNAGISWSRVMDAYNSWSELDENKTMTATEKAVTFAKEIDKSSLTDTQKDVVKENLKFHVSMPVDAGKYNDMVDAGLDPDVSVQVSEVVSALEPEDGNKSVTAMQRYKAITDMSITEDQKAQALSQYMSDTAYEKMTVLGEYKITPTQYVDYLDRADANANGAISQDEAKRYIDKLDGLTNRKRAALWQATNTAWKSEKNPYSTAVGAETKEKLG